MLQVTRKKTWYTDKLQERKHGILVSWYTGKLQERRHGIHGGKLQERRHGILVSYKEEDMVYWQVTRNKTWYTGKL